MDWDNPAERLALIERIGVEAYNEALAEHLKKTTISAVGGHGIRAIRTKFGKLYQVMGTDKAFKTLEKAEAYAAAHPVECE
jgi:hypothetical protein